MGERDRDEKRRAAILAWHERQSFDQLLANFRERRKSAALSRDGGEG